MVCNALFYYYLENERKTQYHSVASKALAWSHIMLMNIGTSAASGVMMLSGYLEGAAMLPINVGERDSMLAKPMKHKVHM